MEEVKELALVKKIMAVLNLDEAGKITKFFNAEIKRFKGEIDKLKMKLKVLELTHKQSITELENNLEDAREDVEKAYEAVTLEDVSNNAAMSAFSTRYWNQVSNAEYNVKSLEERMKDIIETYDEEVARINEQITKREDRIKKISK